VSSLTRSTLFRMKTRRCGRCQHDLPLAAFAWRRAERGQRDNYCYRCRAVYKREHYAANRERYIRNASVRRQREVRRRMRVLLEYLAEHPCTDCGRMIPWCSSSTTSRTSSSISRGGCASGPGRPSRTRSRSARWSVRTVTDDEQHGDSARCGPQSLLRAWRPGAERRRRYSARPRGCSSMVEPQPSKLVVRVQFPSPAPRRPGKVGAHAGSSLAPRRPGRHRIGHERLKRLISGWGRSLLSRSRPSCSRPVISS
jgi:hypothetical protein